ncbi:carbonic anhydrase [Maricaulis sp.]|jgi:carbonic anhydrase|uniref:carbonic anhydrase n=1 Tax=Maricaulis sp. TaxID=1486257 RepID=UPI00260662C6|nr:carbonic anhydrase [Maricaulis sp.]
MQPAAPETLIDGYRRFRGGRFAEERAHYAELAEGQTPHTLVIACSDSRVDPAAIFDAAPGELFVVRNVANLVPPVEEGGGLHGVSAALEFAVKVLKVRGVLVMGHGDCGGVKACASGMDGVPTDYLGPWLSTMEPAREQARAQIGEASLAELSSHLELVSIEHSVERLKAFPFVADAIAERNLEIHGARFSIADGKLEWLAGDGRFETVSIR